MSFALPRHKISKSIEHFKSLNHEIVADMQGEDLSISDIGIGRGLDKSWL